MNAVVLSTVLVCCFGTSVLAANSTLVNMGDIWTYYKTSQPSEKVPESWTRPDFEDTAWHAAGTSVDLEHRKPVPQEVGSGASTSHVYMRRRFHVDQIEHIRTLRLKVEHEFGFKAYLNGTLVSDVRTNGVRFVKGLDPYLPQEEDALLQIADLDWTPYRNLLQTGDNIIALESDQTSAGASALTLNALLTANIPRGPFIQSTTPTNTLIVWRTDVPLNSIVDYGKTPLLGSSITNSEATTNHVIQVANLTPNTVYFYRVRSEDEEGSIASNLDYFRTFKTKGSVHFVYVGDTGQNTAAQFFNAKVMADLGPDLVVHGGDIVYGGFDDKTPDDRVFAQYLRYSGQMLNTPFFFTLGNHDLNCCGGVSEYNPTNFVLNATSFQKTFYLPTNSATGTEHFYSFDDGDVHFVALFNPWFTVYDFNTNTVQYQWLTNDLATTEKPWKVLFFHSPMAHSGLHSTADRNGNRILDQVEVMATVGGAAAKYGVQLVLCSHEHNYERFHPTNGVHTVVSGGGGAGLYEFLSRHPQSEQFYSANHCLNIDISGDTAVIQAVTTNGFVFDQWVIQQSPPLEPMYEAAWNTPVVEENSPNDKDGNITGQTFNLTGKPILAQHGQFSNLGWFYVNNDAASLHVGFAGVMIPDDANLFLFLEVPGLEGVSSCAGLGNGIIDPAGEGADGLDCLENLAFKDWTPNIGMVLGDEYADTNLPNFARPKLGLNIGQGVYYLKGGLSAVDGVRLQQFNRSPQVYTVDPRSNGASLEQNADYIEVSIPLSALGYLAPGETIRVAAVVGTGKYDTNQMTRVLDSTLLGSGLTTTADGLTYLSPIQVRLASPTDLDADADGLPDAWEILHGLRPDVASGVDGALGDPDGDGSTNMEEFLAGTDPQDPESVLKLTLSVLGNRRVKLEWPIQPGQSYVIQYADDPNNVFSDLYRATNTIRSPLRPGSIVDLPPSGPADIQRTYRLRLEP